MVVSPLATARSLTAAVSTGGVAAFCDRHGIALLVLFGSAARDVPEARDVDLAVRTAGPGSLDQLAVLQDLYEMTGSEAVDLLDLRRAGPVARERALVGGLVLHEATPGLFANQQIAAVMERMETAAFREAGLRLAGA